MKFQVTLHKSENTYIKYPAKGLIDIMETGVNGEIINAVFILNSESNKKYPPVVITKPIFTYQ